MPGTGVGGGSISLLPTDPATLLLLPDRPDLRVENRDKTPPVGLFFSLLMTLARSEPTPKSLSVPISMKACGNIPHLPFWFVPDQHQNS